MSKLHQNVKFSKKDYESSDGFLTLVWGPMVWNFLHIVSFNYPVKPTQNDKDNYKNYLLSLGKVLPCKYCRDNFQNNLVKAGFSDSVFENRDCFSKFIYKLHNCVNKMLKKECRLSYSDVRDRYENFRARCLNDVPIIPKHREKESGCLNPLYGKKSKCVIHIVPFDSKIESFMMDSKCVVKKSALKKSQKRKSSKK